MLSDYCEYVEVATNRYLDEAPKELRKEIGQFFTPSVVARYMASHIASVSKTVKILDPGAGGGILTAAAVDRLASDGAISSIHADLYETDDNILTILRSNMEHIKDDLRSRSICFTFEIFHEDFLLHNAGSWSGLEEPPKYDVIISNPPFFKMRKNDKAALLMSEVVYGQPNIYSLFMSMAAMMLRKGGSYVFITPRSYASGLYFKRMRQWLFSALQLKSVHVFNSRDQIFSDSILQELVITSATTRGGSDSGCLTIEVSESISDLDSAVKMDAPYDRCVSVGEHSYLYLPTSRAELDILDIVGSWNLTLDEVGFQMKTGPVIDFRSAGQLQDTPEGGVLIIWPYNFIDNEIRYPIANEKKPQYLTDCPESLGKQIRNGNYIFIKRFTAKEEKRRLQCALFRKSGCESRFISAENHVNYVVKKDGEMADDELYGLFVLFNSHIVDQYYRILDGSTQVNSSEINAMPSPPLETIKKIGKYVAENHINYSSSSICDELILTHSERGSHMNKVKEAQEVLRSIGLPDKQTNERSAYVLLALCGIKEADDWSTASKRNLRIHDIIAFINYNYHKDYKENTRETIRKDTLHQFVEASVAERNQLGSVPTNSPRYSYCLTDEMLDVVRSFSPMYRGEMDLVELFLNNHGALREKYLQKRQIDRVSVLVNDEQYSFSPGAHNQLQKAIVEEFASRFLPKPEVLYIGDTEKKDLIKKADVLNDLGIEITDHDKLPDVIIQDKELGWVVFVEAVVSTGPMSVKRVEEIEALSSMCTRKRIYVTAFPNLKTFKKFVGEVAWETEVWISDIPDHMIHLNGDKFISAHR